MAGVSLQGLVHGEVGGSGEPPRLPVLPRLQLEHLQQPVLPTARDIPLTQETAVPSTYTTKYVRIYKEYHRVCPLVGIGTPRPPTPFPQASVPMKEECAPPLRNQRGEGHTRLRVKGWGSPNSDDWRKSLALCLLCDIYCTHIVSCLLSCFPYNFLKRCK